MKNRTTVTVFHILAFSTEMDYTLVICSIFSWLYLIGLLMNGVIITVICKDQHLHSPLYLFLCNLSFADISSTTTTIPNLMYMLLLRKNVISSVRCFAQIYFVFLAISTEDMLLVTMAYDRYVAICHPLHYHNILSRTMCSLIIASVWIIASLNSLILTITASNMVFCHSNTIRQFFCEAMTVAKIASSGTEVFYMTVYVEMFILGLGSFLCSLTSYVKIIVVIIGIKLRDGRRKAFSTCSSHLIVITLYYGTAVFAYMTPTSKNSDLPEQIMTAIYMVITPMLNPLIYSLQNKQLRGAVHKLMMSHF